jgi:type III secretion protein J
MSSLRDARVWPTLGLCLLSGWLAGCQVEVQHDLNEKEANEIVVALEKAGITSDKIKQEGGNTSAFSVAVPKGEKARAMEILVANQLPKPRPNGIKELFPGGEMIPTQTAEAMRKLSAQQGEIAQTLMNIDGVLSAGVNLNIPEKSELDDKEQPKPSASVVITYRVTKGGQDKPPVTEEQVRGVVANAVENLDPKRVTVVLNPSTLPGGADVGEQFVDVLGLRMSNDSVGTFKAMAAVAILSILGLATWVGMLYYARGAAPARPARARPGPASEA